MAAPGTGTGATQMDQRLLTNTWPKTIHNIYMQTIAKTKKQYKNIKNSTRKVEKDVEHDARIA